MKKIATAFLLLSMGFGTHAIAQNKLSIDKVYSVTLRNSGTINENNQIKGYYFFYQSDKIDRKTNEYTLQIVDENLNKIKDIKFTDSKDIALMESSFNGTSVVFVFYDDDQNMLDYRLYNLDGKKSFTYSKTLDKKSERYFKQQLEMSQKEEGENQNVYDVPEKGFITVTPVREDRNYTYDISFYASGKRKTWTYNPVENGKFTGAQYLGCNDSIAVLEVLSKERMMSKETESSLLGISLETGKKVFEVRTQEGSKALYPMNISQMAGRSEFLVIGPYYNANDKILQDKTEGLGVWMMNNQGKIVKSKYITWQRDLNRYVNVDDKGRVEDMGWIYFHKVMQTEDGKIFAIGEGYKKVADGLGIALNALSMAGGGYAGASNTKLKITNLMTFELSPNFDLVSAKMYVKNNNNFSLGASGFDFVSPHTLALLAKTYGAFDYAFTQMGQNKSTFVSGYTDYQREKDYKGYVFNSISYADGKITNDRINLKTEASSIRLMPAKPGFVLLVEYYKKAKRMDMRMEKIN